MIHETVAYINALIDGLGVFPVRYGITTLEQGEDFTAPAIYKGGGDSEQIGFDFNQAQVYHRILGYITGRSRIRYGLWVECYAVYFDESGVLLFTESIRNRQQQYR
jgi:hypothetical protein